MLHVFWHWLICSQSHGCKSYQAAEHNVNIYIYISLANMYEP